MKLLHLLLITSTSKKTKLPTSVRAHTCVKGQEVGVGSDLNYLYDVPAVKHGYLQLTINNSSR
jgi:hypothetical protein